MRSSLARTPARMSDDLPQPEAPWTSTEVALGHAVDDVVDHPVPAEEYGLLSALERPEPGIGVLDRGEVMVGPGPNGKPPTAIVASGLHVISLRDRPDYQSLSRASRMHLIVLRRAISLDQPTG